MKNFFNKNDIKFNKRKEINTYDILTMCFTFQINHKDVYTVFTVDNCGKKTIS